MEIKQLQFLQQNIREVIRNTQEHITDLKAAKRVYDENGLIEQEYIVHNELVEARKQLAKWVSLQKAVKRQQREIHGQEQLNYALQVLIGGLMEGDDEEVFE